MPALKTSTARKPIQTGMDRIDRIKAQNRSDKSNQN
jgi:hypothetical protein